MTKKATNETPGRREPPVVKAPDLPYLPRDPRKTPPKIGLVGCGGITNYHLEAYQKAGYEVVTLCDVEIDRARERRDEFYPQASITDDAQEAIEHEQVEIVDITTHPPERPPLIEAAIKAGKHVLSQKPFVLDLEVGEQLAALAEEHGVLLAVNQNGRWAPHFSYLRAAQTAGLLGELSAVHFAVHWDHGWVKGTKFEEVRHLILYDFAIHWFDMLTCLMGNRKPQRVYASFTKSATQEARPALLGQAVVEYEGAQASLVFDGDTRFGPWEITYVTGSRGTIRSEGKDVNEQQILLETDDGIARPKLEGSWFPDGFHGTMGELMCAIEAGQAPSHSARNNLASLELCFAAVASAERGEPVVPGTVRRLPDEAL